jgi:hypothetical protein
MAAIPSVSFGRFRACGKVTGAGKLDLRLRLRNEPIFFSRDDGFA